MAVWSDILIRDIEQCRIDAEYYQPKYLYAKTLLGDKQLRKFGISVQHPAEVKRVYSSKGIQIVLAQNNRSNFYDWSEKRFMPEHFKNVLKSNRLEFGDVTVTRSGANYGQTSVITIEEKQNLFACADLLIIRTSEISGPLLSTFFNTKIGKDLVERGVYGSGQPHIAPAYIKEIPFPSRLLKINKEIEKIILTSRTLSARSQSLYSNAQEFLERELGLDKLKFDKPLSYEAKLSDVIGNNRADADYYQVPFRILGKHLATLDTKPLSRIVNLIKGIEVGSSSYVESGIPFIRVSNVKEAGITFGNSDKYISHQLYSKLKLFQPQIGELLLTKDGTPGVCYAVSEPIDGITSGGVVRLVIKEKRVPLEYLALVLNSRVCRMQVAQECSGALIVHWKPGSIKRLRIPLLSDSVMKELGQLVSESKKARTESQQLLEQAKRRVEEFIEQGVRN
ncbi:MAG: hypothetical protein IT292_07240 [Deltaproteobacteria bacterium]|nr:hypothetical protein [Deltaproteobacteria bacterium]